MNEAETALVAILRCLGQQLADDRRDHARNSVRAHPMAPSLLELREDSEDSHHEDSGRVLVVWKVSLLNAQAAGLEPILPSSCRTVGPG